MMKLYSIYKLKQYKNHVFKLNKVMILSIIVISVLSALILKKDIFDTHTLCVALMLCSAVYYRYVYYIVIVNLVIFGAYALVGFSYGLINMSMIASLMDTNLNESVEFFSTISIKTWLLTISYIFFSYLFLKFVKITINNQQSTINNLVLCLIILILFRGSYFYTLYNHAIKSYRSYQYEKNILIQSLDKKDSWEILSIKPHKKEKVFVIIIGESMRKDYMSVYAYPHLTTPFLNKSNGLFIDGMYSMAPNTVPSLSRTLRLQDHVSKAFISENNVVTLAQKSGFKVYWLSAQGMLGEHDTSTSAVAFRANKQYFLNKGSYDMLDTNDDDLLLPFKKILSEKNNLERHLFIFHLLGSHPDACKRLHNYPVQFNIGYGKQVNCYLASIAKTDRFIENVVNILSDREYSIVYFSDHGLSVSKEAIKVDATIQNSYQIPFFILDNEIKEHIDINHRISQKHFLDFMATWFGVETQQTDVQYDFFKLSQLPKADKIEVFNWHEFIDVTTLKQEEILK